MSAAATLGRSAPAAVPREVRGPAAFGDSGRQFWILIRQDVRSEFRLRYQNSILGFVWSIANPLLMFIVLYLWFSHIIEFGDTIPNFAALIILNLMLYRFFAEATGVAVTSLLSRETYIRRAHFPAAAVPCAKVASSLVDLMLTIPVVLLILVAVGVEPMWSWLGLPLLVFVLVLFTLGAAFLLSALFVFVRDIQQLWGVVLRVLFFASPVMYPIEFAPDTFQTVLSANPLAPILTLSRKWVVDPGAPGVLDAVGGWGGVDRADRCLRHSLRCGCRVLRPPGANHRRVALVPASDRARAEVTKTVTEPDAPDSGADAGVELLAPLPDSIEVGRGSVLWLEGRQSSSERRRRSFRLFAGERSQDLLARNMPRPAAASSRDWWWAVMPIEHAAEEQQVTLEVEEKVGIRERRRRPIGTIAVRSDLEIGRVGALVRTNPPLGAVMGFPDLGPMVAICLPTKDPDLRRLRQQIRSLRHQSYENFRCVIVDDGSDEALLDKIERTVAGDDRFELHRGAGGLGAYRNVERALSLAPPDAPYVAIAEQGDRWFPHRLEILLSSFDTSTLMVHSGLLNITEDGEIVRDRDENRDCQDLGRLLMDSSVVTGSCVLRREVLAYALPFPPQQRGSAAGRWIPLLVRALGDIRFVDAALCDRLFVNPAGASDADERDDRPEAPSPEADRGGRSDYFAEVAWGLVAGEVVRIRCWELMRPRDRRELARFLGMVRGEKLFNLLLLALRTRSKPETSVERRYVRGVFWLRRELLRARFVRGGPTAEEARVAA